MKTVVLNVKPDLVRFLHVKYARYMKEDILYLPVRSPLYRFLNEQLYHYSRRSLTRPKGNLVLRLSSAGNSQNSAWFHQLSDTATHELERMVDAKMRQEVYALMKANRKNKIPYINTVYEFIQKYGIQNLTEEAFLRGYRRNRKR